MLLLNFGVNDEARLKEGVKGRAQEKDTPAFLCDIVFYMSKPFAYARCDILSINKRKTKNMVIDGAS